MCASLKSVDEQVWVSVMNEFTVLDTPIGHWSKEQILESSFNNIELNSIFKVFIPKNVP